MLLGLPRMPTLAVRRNDLDTLTAEEARRLLSAAEGTRLEALWWLAVAVLGFLTAAGIERVVGGVREENRKERNRAARGERDLRSQITPPSPTAAEPPAEQAPEQPEQ